VFTVCDKAAGEVCPVWPGQPVTAHWGVPDPTSVQGTRIESMGAVEEALRILERRISVLALASTTAGALLGEHWMIAAIVLTALFLMSLSCASRGF
jgi:hypothetical protein